MISYLTIQPLDKGDIFPEFHGKTLTNQKLVFPGNLKGKIGLLFFTFMREGHNQVDSWLTPIQKKYSDLPDLNHFSVSMVREYNKLHRFVLNRSFRWFIPKENRTNTVFYSGKLEKFYCYFNVNSLSDCYVFLLDRDNKIQYVECGSANSEKLRDIFLVINKLTATPKEFVTEH